MSVGLEEGVVVQKELWWFSMEVCFSRRMCGGLARKCGGLARRCGGLARRCGGLERRCGGLA